MSQFLTFFSTLWWLGFFTALGLCAGSFLNAVIYRLPRDRSLYRPLWSFCPTCRRRIAWHDNIPVISFILLRGRCRNCSVPIGTHYVVIEVITALFVLMLLDAFLIGGIRSGLSDSPFGLTDRLAYDWPILAAHAVLFICLLPMAVIDLEHYWVDVRFTNFATVTGFLLHAFWTPRHSMEWIRPGDTLAVMSVFAIVGLGLVGLVQICRPAPEDEESGAQEPAVAAEAPSAEPAPRRPPPSLASPSRASGWIACAMLGALFVALLLDEGGGFNLRHTGRALLPLCLLFALIIGASLVQRPADVEIVEAIDQERHYARRMVLSELALLLPAVALAAVGWWIMTSEGPLTKAIHASLDAGPLLGLATAAAGYLVAGAIGWTVRIVFTLVFGREAFGTGDIHLMAATGCVAGWPVVLLGFFLTCGLAMIGWVAALPFKRTRALPLGPWLALSFLTVVVFYDSILKWPLIERAIETVRFFLLDSPPRALFEPPL